jgi:hypothetical protein
MSGADPGVSGGGTGVSDCTERSEGREGMPKVRRA